MDATSRESLAEYCERRADVLRKRADYGDLAAAIALEEIALWARTSPSERAGYAGVEDEYPKFIGVDPGAGDDRTAMRCPVCGLDTTGLAQCRREDCPNEMLRKQPKT